MSDELRVTSDELRVMSDAKIRKKFGIIDDIWGYPTFFVLLSVFNTIYGLEKEIPM